MSGFFTLQKWKSMEVIFDSIAVIGLIMAITAMILSFLSPNSIKQGLLAEIAAIKVVTTSLKTELDAVRGDVNAFNRDTFKKLAEKINLMEIEIHGIDNKVTQTETARKNWGNKWSLVLGKLKKEVEISDEEVDKNETPDIIDINNYTHKDGVVPPTIEPAKGFASLMG